MSRMFRIFLEEEDVTPRWWKFSPKTVGEFGIVLCSTEVLHLIQFHEQMFGIRPTEALVPMSWVTDNYINQVIKGTISSPFIGNVTFTWRDLPYAAFGMLTLRIVEEV